MIKNLSSSSPYVQVFQPYNHITHGNTSATGYGAISFDFNMQTLQVHDGYGWKALAQDASVSTSPMLNDAVNWVIAKMKEERELKEKMEKFPALKKAHENFETIKNLVNNYVDPEETK